MQTVRQATNIATYVTGTNAGRATQIAHALTSAKVLPKSSGRAFKKISGQQFLSLVAALAMADKVTDAPAVAVAFAALPLNGNQPIQPELAEAIGPLSSLSDIFGTVMDPDGDWREAEIEFSKTASGYTAKITSELVHGDHVLSVTLPFYRERTWGGFCKSSFTISAEGVTVMRNLFARDDIEGMEFRLAPHVGGDE